jgi:DNA segregation ATPase FtsK/SpoIIIE-like protein
MLPLALCPLVALLRPGSERAALERAELLLAWQRTVGVAVEPSVHAWFSAHAPLATVATVFYLGAHLSALIATACWLAARHRAAYLRFRATFAVAQILTVVTYLAVPVAPLRMLLNGESATAGASWSRSMQYEFAAMPSGHVVFALVVGVAIWRHAPSGWRWLGIAHPTCTLVTVVATANHLLVDAAAAVPVVVVATSAVRLAEIARVSAGRTTRRATEEGLAA